MKAKQLILETMDGLITRKSGDTIWITDTETMFDRLGSIYLESGGTIEELREKFPEYI